VKRNQTSNPVPGPDAERVAPPTMAGVGARIARAADALGTREAAARTMGVSPAALQRYVREINNPPFDALARLCLQSGVRMEWLATGEGPQQVAHVQTQPHYESATGPAPPRGRVAEAAPGLSQAGDAARAAIARLSGAAPQPDRFALALALVDEALGANGPGAAAPLAYLIEAVYELLGDGATASPAHVLRVVRNALALRT